MPSRLIAFAGTRYSANLLYSMPLRYVAILLLDDGNLVNCCSPEGSKDRSGVAVSVRLRYPLIRVMYAVKVLSGVPIKVCALAQITCSIMPVTKGVQATAFRV